MDIEAVILGSLLLIGASAGAAEVQHGIVKLDGAGHVLLVVAEPLAAGHEVYFQYPAGRQQALCCRRLAGGEFSASDGAELLVTNERTGGAAIVYKARMPRVWAERPFVGSTVIGRRLRVKDENGRLVVRTAEGRVSWADMCTSQEGVHVIGKTDFVETARLYLGLGYDIEHPSCK